VGDNVYWSYSCTAGQTAEAQAVGRAKTIIVIGVDKYAITENIGISFELLNIPENL